MLTKGSALNVGKGWAVASLFRRAREHIQLKKLMRNGGLILVSLMVAHAAYATSTDLLASQNSTVTSTFGHGSSLEKYFYYGEIIAALFLYIKSRSPAVFIGFLGVVIFTRVCFAIAG